MAEVLVLSDRDVADIVSFEENLRMVEQAFADHSAGRSRVFPVVREEIKEHGGIFGIKSGYLPGQEALGFKAGGFWSGNKAAGLTNHQSVMVLFTPQTGQPCALVAANFVTQVRTAASGAIGCKYLARPDSAVLALIGAGQQGRNQLAAALRVLPRIATIYLYDAVPAAAAAMAGELAAGPRKIAVAATAEEACRGADVIITAASSYRPIVMAGWVKPGTHINAVGTDTRGKQELDANLFAGAKVVVDDTAQCIYLGECQHPYDAGIITRQSIHAEIGEIIAGAKPGRTAADGITIYDTTGVAVQDLATAGYAYEQARTRGIGQWVAI